MVFNHILRRPVRTTIITVLVILVVLFLSTGGTHKLQPALFDITPGRRLSSQNAAAVCRKHGFSPYRPPGRKVYDLFPFNVELDWLDIRLNTLASYVDYFVIVEGRNTFTNLPKPAYLERNWENFTTFHPQMLHYVVEDPIDSTRTWDHEDFFRDALLYKTFPHFRGSAKQANDGDVIILSDIDEIPKPETVELLRHCDFPARLTLRSHFYYYSFQWLHHGEQWAHPQATIFRGLKNTISPVHLRNGEGGPSWSLLPFMRPLQRWWQKSDLWSSTWHCSSCFATIKEMRTKMESFSHTPWNTEENRDAKTMVERVRNGVDLFGRETEVYDKVDNNPDVPSYILTKQEEYGYLLDRDGQDAAFKDYDLFF
ncbi:uncharacterized protein LTR77_009063 [Saxophila tyrrhenica]|uniref:Beta-1,4-mannosyl-glycoprotein 4-beta-N-acetylglucosaminyltransferase n=1 Tax=Saxophila tyrrhenica TaxID=1690608 RepID=A0AAV9P001_9PEZI|nr:hypothetical protein LTR77_009063 [Saxophila tyrrhenica]